MSLEAKLLTSLLKMTKANSVLIEDVKIDSRLPIEYCSSLLKKLQQEDIINIIDNQIEVDTTNRLKIAVKAISLGADIQDISNQLDWHEFEEITAIALKNNGYSVHNNLRFKKIDHRFEIDVVATKKPIVLCVDCKHWKRAITPSTLKRIVEEQTLRTKALADSLPNKKLALPCTQWEKAMFIPAILSLIPNAFKFYYEVPIVPVLQIQDFISQLPLNMDSVKVFSQTFQTLT